MDYFDKVDPKLDPDRWLLDEKVRRDHEQRPIVSKILSPTLIFLRIFDLLLNYTLRGRDEHRAVMVALSGFPHPTEARAADPPVPLAVLLRDLRIFVECHRKAMAQRVAWLQRNGFDPDGAPVKGDPKFFHADLKRAACEAPAHSRSYEGFRRLATGRQMAKMELQWPLTDGSRADRSDTAATELATRNKTAWKEALEWFTDFVEEAHQADLEMRNLMAPQASQAGHSAYDPKARGQM
ncbi:hypothetical protein JCM3770_000605 [Rhodotorula araucariae]